MLLLVDGGGTKTHVLITEDSGEYITDVKGGPLSFAVISKEEALRNLLSIINATISKLNRPDVIFSRALIGLAGVDTAEETSDANIFFASTLKTVVQGTVRVVNDSEIALASGTNKQNAVVIISGTGSNCFGRNDMGQTAKSGGLDYLLSDEGSAYDIGLKILKAAVMSADGREEKTELEDLVKNYFSVTEIVKLKQKVYAPGFNKASIARISLLLPQALEKNDNLALKILDDAVESLVNMVRAVCKNLHFEDQVFDLVASGGMFSDAMISVSRFSQSIKEEFPKAVIIRPQKPPVYGALNLLLGTAK